MTQNGHGVQVVTISDDHKYTLKEDELREVLLNPEIKDLPVVVISVAGAYRGGKSFLLNLFLKYLTSPIPSRVDGSWCETGDEPLGGFSWRGGSKRNTTGILLWSEPIVGVLPTGQKVAILLMDTQGTFDNTSSTRDCSTIFALSTLLSSIQIYNLSQKIQEDNLQHLQLFTDYGKLIKDESGKPFQVLEFLIRDWMNPFEYEYGLEGGKMYLEEQLKIEDGMLTELKELREHIKSSFETVSCFLMPHPGLIVAKPKFKGTSNEISPEFKSALKELTASLFSEAKLKVKQVNGEPVKAKELFEYFKTYMNIFNSNKIPSPTSIFEATSKASLLSAVNEAMDLYNTNMDKACGANVPSVSAYDVKYQHGIEMTAAQENFANKKKLCSKKDEEIYKAKLAEKLVNRGSEYLNINRGKTQKAIADAKKAYEATIETISKGQPLCVHAVDLAKVHDEAGQAAVQEYDRNRKKLTAQQDPDKDSLLDDLARTYNSLSTTNSQNNKLAASEVYAEFERNMMLKCTAKPSLSDEKFQEEFNKAKARALSAFDSKRNRPNAYTEDVFRHKLEEDLDLNFLVLKQINKSANKESFQMALLVFNENIIPIRGLRRYCYHPDDLRKNFDDAVCAAKKAFKPERSCSEVDNNDRDEITLMQIFNNRFEALADINSDANQRAVQEAFMAFKDKYYELTGASWTWIFIVPIIVAASKKSGYFEEAKAYGREVFSSKRRTGAYHKNDPYLQDLEAKMDAHYS